MFVGCAWVVLSFSVVEGVHEVVEVCIEQEGVVERKCRLPPLTALSAVPNLHD
jgi:hypothetical protein